jgi:hypothetical protein
VSLGAMMYDKLIGKCLKGNSRVSIDAQFSNFFRGTEEENKES